MKQIKIKPGVVLISVCDEHILVATREARKTVPYVRQINSAGGFYWNLLEKGEQPESIIKAAQERYHISARQASGMVLGFIKKLYSAGYIIIQDVEENE